MPRDNSPSQSQASRPRAHAWLRWAQLSSQDKVAAVEALAVVATVRLLLSVTPNSLTAKAVRRLMTNVPIERAAHTTAVEAIRQTSEAVRRASLRVSNATCLVQAVAGWLMLRRRGVRAAVRIGVQTESRLFSAHAWLCVGDAVVIGGEDAAVRFVTLEEHRGH